MLTSGLWQLRVSSRRYHLLCNASYLELQTHQMWNLLIQVMTHDLKEEIVKHADQLVSTINPLNGACAHEQEEVQKVHLL